MRHKLSEHNATMERVTYICDLSQVESLEIKNQFESNFKLWNKAASL